MVFRRRWHPIWLLCLALASLPGLSFLASRLNAVPQRPSSMVTITANGVGFAVQDVNADSLLDLVLADGAGGRFIQLENDGNGVFTPCVAREMRHQSGPRPTDSATAADWLTRG